jgi:hypothetical protein
MLLEGKLASVAIVGAGAAVIAVFEGLPAIGQDLVLASLVIGAIKIIASAIRTMVRWAREVHASVTSDLPDRMGKVEGGLEIVQARLGDGQDRFRDMETQIDALSGRVEVLGQREAAAVSGALHAVAHPIPPRPSRATDPGVRTGWRE